MDITSFHRNTVLVKFSTFAIPDGLEKSAIETKLRQYSHISVGS